MRWLKDERGSVMAYYVFLIALVIMPLMVMTTEITRAMFVDIHLQSATDAACSAASQAVNVPYFIQNGVLKIDLSAARTYAYREFDSTVSDSTLRRYTPILTSVNLLTDSMVGCEAVAQMTWVLPGIPALTVHSSAVAGAQATR